MSASRKTVLAVISLAGAALGAILGFVTSMWGGIEVILPVTTIIFAGLSYLVGRMTFAVIDAYR
jgi:hypothetical protein